MKKYKLKKDFPGSKIGDVWVKADSGFMSPEVRDTIKMHEHLFEPFNDWFEDYEEPKEYWFINELGNVEKAPSDWLCDEKESRESIGNYFKTKEEAEKAVEKLKAWRRLKDKGFRFKDWELKNGRKIFFGLDDKSFNAGWLDEEIAKDLDLLFGGEE